MALLFDLESNGLLHQMDRIHCIVAYDTDTDLLYIADPEHLPIEQVVRMIQNYDGDVWAHNGIGFDYEALRLIYPDFVAGGDVRNECDTLVACRLLFSNIKDSDFARMKSGRLPGKLIGSHSLKAWGYRLTEFKQEFETDWSEWTPAMTDYCIQDVKVLKEIYEKLTSHEMWEQCQEALELEHDVQRIIERQSRYGFLFDVEKAEALHVKLLKRKEELLSELTAKIPQRIDMPKSVKKIPWNWREEGWTAPTFEPKVRNKKIGYVPGQPCTKIAYYDFEPGSAVHVYKYLISKYGWQPEEFTDKSGEPKIDEDILQKLAEKWPELALIAEYWTVQKRISQLATGKEAWLHHVKDDGRIHGYINTMGTATYRMSHSRPNVAQVPAGRSPYGEECRELFHVPPDRKLVGCDADGLEARCLASYLARYDDGVYIDAVVNGKKADGTDVHTMNQRAFGAATRDDAKTLFYAMIYGGGDKCLGDGNFQLGKQRRAKFMKANPAYANLVNTVTARAKNQGWIKGIDGRPIYIRSLHSALNFLLQSAGALIMKRALVIADNTFQSQGWVPGDDYEFVANVHDEFQIECKPEIADEIGKIAADSIRQAGEYYPVFRCPLSGSYDIGDSWKETH